MNEDNDQEYLTKKDFEVFKKNHFAHLKSDVEEIKDDLPQIIGGIYSLYAEIQSNKNWVKGVLLVLIPLTIALVTAVVT